VEQLDSPDREVLQLGSSLECTSPAPGSAAISSAAAGWDYSYDPTQVTWDEEPAAHNASYNGYEDQTANTASEYGANQTSGSMEDSTDHGVAMHEHEYHNYDHYQHSMDG